jgi:hypothetical protein
MQGIRWLLFASSTFSALACLVFLLTYVTRAQGFSSAVGRTLIAIKFGIFGVSALLSLNIAFGFDILIVRWIFSLLMIQIGCAVLWQTYTIFRVNGKILEEDVNP